MDEARVELGDGCGAVVSARMLSAWTSSRLRALSRGPPASFN